MPKERNTVNAALLQLETLKAAKKAEKDALNKAKAAEVVEKLALLDILLRLINSPEGYCSTVLVRTKINYILIV